MKRPSSTRSDEPPGRPTGRRGLAIAILLPLFACSTQSSDDRLDPLGLIPPPPTITASEAGAHVGELVVVRTKIASARVERGQAVLQPEGIEPGGFVISIAPPVVGPTARELAAEYDGQDVRAVGYVSDLGNDLELLIGDPGRIRLANASDVEPVSAAAAPKTPTKITPPAAEPEPARAAAEEPAPPVAPEPAAPVVAAAAVPAAPTPDPACENARRAWAIAAADAKAPLRELLDCLDEGEPRCKDAAARARVALAEVAASEERLSWVCGGGGS